MTRRMTTTIATTTRITTTTATTTVLFKPVCVEVLVSANIIDSIKHTVEN